MRFVSFNVNGIRARLHQIAAVRESYDPDVVAIQEIKVADDAFPLEAVKACGFEHVHYYGQKGHYGVALLSNNPPTSVQLGIPWGPADQQRRFMSAVYEISSAPVTVINGYFPQGENRDHPQKFPAKAKFYEDVNRYLRECCDPEEHLIVAGDMNVAPDDEDIGIGEDNRKRWLRDGKASFLPEERAWLQQIMDWGLHDSYAIWVKGGPRLYSWFDYRSRGFERDPKRGLRIDLVLTSASLSGQIDECGVDYDIRGQERPSDHCPVWCNFTL
jgi:exodeoxyribonuclease-3